jgi:hypothetical protein
MNGAARWSIVIITCGARRKPISRTLMEAASRTRWHWRFAQMVFTFGPERCSASFRNTVQLGRNPQRAEVGAILLGNRHRFGEQFAEGRFHRLLRLRPAIPASLLPLLVFANYVGHEIGCNTLRRGALYALMGREGVRYSSI